MFPEKIFSKKIPEKNFPKKNFPEKILKPLGPNGPTVCRRRLQPSAGARKKPPRRAAIFVVYFLSRMLYITLAFNIIYLRPSREKIFLISIFRLVKILQNISLSQMPKRSNFLRFLLMHNSDRHMELCKKKFNVFFYAIDLKYSSPQTERGLLPK